MIDAATKFELIKKIASLPESLPDESTVGERLAEIERLFAAIDTLLSSVLEHEEKRERNWQTTVEAMEAARRGEAVTVDGIDGLFAYLHADEDADA
jgi:hypothetical protein